MKALIDGDIVAYRCGFSGQHNHHEVMNLDGIVVYTTDFKREATAYVKKMDHPDRYEIYTSIEVEPIENILHSVKLMIEEIMANTGCTEHEIFITGTTNFRKELSTSYKANRDPNKKPVALPDIEEYLIKHHGAIRVEGEEAGKSDLLTEDEQHEWTL